jgi:hypothetical protein
MDPIKCKTYLENLSDYWFLKEGCAMDLAIFILAMDRFPDSLTKLFKNSQYHNYVCIRRGEGSHPSDKIQIISILHFLKNN